jgi:hypothetical protein
MTTPTPPDAAQALEEALRALAETLPEVVRIKDVWDAIKQAAALGAAYGRAEAFEEAEATLIDIRWPLEQREHEMARRKTLLTVLDALRARVASTGSVKP